MRTITKTSQSQSETTKPKPPAEQKVLKLKQQRKAEKRVTWTEDTVDNENMGRMKSNSNLISMLHIQQTPGARSR